MLTINLNHSVKGGVGKSTWARILCAYCEARQVPHLAYEANRDTPDLAGFYPKIQEEGRIFKFSDSNSKNDAPNVVANTAIEQKIITIVNMPAAVSSTFDQWLDTFHVLDFLETNNARMVNWFVTNGDPDSLDPFLDLLSTYGSKIGHVLVRNLNFMEPSAVFDQKILDLAQQHGAKTINLPALPKRIQDAILGKQLQYNEAVHYTGDPNLGPLDRSAVKGFLNKCFAAIDSTGIFDGVAGTAEKPQPPKK
jgi:hypothetical protein